MSEVMTPVPADHPLMLAWKSYEDSQRFKNALQWANKGNAHGSLWGAFEAGFRAAAALAAALHESVDPASDAERLAGHPGAGAMGAVIEYRDVIRKHTHA